MATATPMATIKLYSIAFAIDRSLRNRLKRIMPTVSGVTVFVALTEAIQSKMLINYFNNLKTCNRSPPTLQPEIKKGALLSAPSSAASGRRIPHFSAVATLLNVVVRLVPNVLTAPMITTLITAAIGRYSMAVAPFHRVETLRL
jgi:hypothetical protein